MRTINGLRSVRQINPGSPGVGGNIGFLCTIYVTPGLEGLMVCKVTHLD